LWVGIQCAYANSCLFCNADSRKLTC
jgi:hypothetical protein